MGRSRRGGTDADLPGEKSYRKIDDGDRQFSPEAGVVERADPMPVDDAGQIARLVAYGGVGQVLHHRGTVPQAPVDERRHAQAVVDEDVLRGDVAVAKHGIRRSGKVWWGSDQLDDPVGLVDGESGHDQGLPVGDEAALGLARPGAGRIRPPETGRRNAVQAGQDSAHVAPLIRTQRGEEAIQLAHEPRRSPSPAALPRRRRSPRRGAPRAREPRRIEHAPWPRLRASRSRRSVGRCADRPRSRRPAGRGTPRSRRRG